MYRSRFRFRAATVAASFFLVAAAALPADAFWSRSNLDPFNPDVNAPSNYEPRSPAIGGTGGDAGPTDCYWSREEVVVAGRLAWRPLKMCHYPSE